MFLTGPERALIKRDFKTMLHGEGSLVTLSYITPLLPGAAVDPDPVYGHDRRIAKSGPVLLPDVKAFIYIVHERNLKILGFGIVEVGDAIFYFADNLNLLEPVKDKPVIDNSLSIIDPHGNEWTPKIGNVAPLKKYLAMTLANDAISEVVPCGLKK